jgi:membrane-associated PAP2 superfamily phosphatase
MYSDPMQPSCWRPDLRFWLLHLALPLAVALALLTLLERTSVDMWLADRWFALEGGMWAWRDHWLAYDVIHHHGKQLVIAFGLLVLALIALSFRLARLRRWRLPMTYLLTGMALLPALIAWFKRISPVACPWDLTRYGGETDYLRTFDYSFGFTDAGHCFPSGHASGGFALLALYFAAYLYVRRPALFLLPGLLVGTVFALGQQARGAHFLSHDLWSLSLCWFGALGLFLLFRPGRWPGPIARCGEPVRLAWSAA